MNRFIWYRFNLITDCFINWSNASKCNLRDVSDAATYILWEMAEISIQHLPIAFWLNESNFTKWKNAWIISWSHIINNIYRNHQNNNAHISCHHGSQEVKILWNSTSKSTKHLFLLFFVFFCFYYFFSFFSSFLLILISKMSPTIWQTTTLFNQCIQLLIHLSFFDFYIKHWNITWFNFGNKVTGGFLEMLVNSLSWFTSFTASKAAAQPLWKNLNQIIISKRVHLTHGNLTSF